MEELIAQYGYLAVLVGTFLEGETIVVLGGLAAHQGLLQLEYVIVAALIGSFLGDQVLYLCGRQWGPRVLMRIPSWRPRCEQALAILQRHQIPFILGFRFLYGLRAVSAFAIGMSGVRPAPFLILNFISAAIWAVSISVLGYACGHAVKAALGHLHDHMYLAFGLIVGGGVLVWLFHVWQRRRRAKRAALLETASHRL
jgi:membrane protein DedA with SNARE-associated domain